jgi:hypothetical protein
MTPPTWRGKSGGLTPKVRLTPLLTHTHIHGRLYTRQYADNAPAPTCLLYHYPRG